jgi:uncharacterized protein YdaU (DUF1376 family)
MAKAPIMPVFTDALIGDTTHLSTEQFGAYVLILLATWRNNGRALPDDDARMARLCRAGVQRWRSKLRPSLVEFFDISDGLWHQHRLEKEWARVESLIAKRRASASAGGRATAARKVSGDGAAIYKDNLEDSESSLDRPESLNAARAKEKKSSHVNPEGGRCAPLGCGPRPGEAATGGMVAAPFLPTNQADLDLDGQNNDNSQQEPAMGTIHGCSVGLAASRPLLGAVAMLGPGSCRRTGKSPALKAEIRARWLFTLCDYGRRRFNIAAAGELVTMCDIALRAGSRAATPPEITQTLDRLDTLRRQEKGIAA